MIAADTSTWIAFLQGQSGDDVQILDRALEDQQVLMPPVVLTELLSDPKIPESVASMLTSLPLLEPDAGFWHRAGVLRAKVLKRRRRARLGDALIAQSCLDREIALLTRDHDFQAFADAAEVRLTVDTDNVGPILFPPPLPPPPDDPLL